MVGEISGAGWTTLDVAQTDEDEYSELGSGDPPLTSLKRKPKFSRSPEKTKRLKQGEDFNVSVSPDSIRGNGRSNGHSPASNLGPSKRPLLTRPISTPSNGNGSSFGTTIAPSISAGPSFQLSKTAQLNKEAKRPSDNATKTATFEARLAKPARSKNDPDVIECPDSESSNVSSDSSLPATVSVSASLGKGKLQRHGISGSQAIRPKHTPRRTIPSVTPKEEDIIVIDDSDDELPLSPSLPSLSRRSIFVSKDVKNKEARGPLPSSSQSTTKIHKIHNGTQLPHQQGEKYISTSPTQRASTSVNKGLNTSSSMKATISSPKLPQLLTAMPLAIQMSKTSGKCSNATSSPTTAISSSKPPQLVATELFTTPAKNSSLPNDPLLPTTQAARPLPPPPAAKSSALSHASSSKRTLAIEPEGGLDNVPLEPVSPSQPAVAQKSPLMRFRVQARNSTSLPSGYQARLAALRKPVGGSSIELSDMKGKQKELPSNNTSSEARLAPRKSTVMPSLKVARKRASLPSGYTATTSLSSTTHKASGGSSIELSDMKGKQQKEVPSYNAPLGTATSRWPAVARKSTSMPVQRRARTSLASVLRRPSSSSSIELSDMKGKQKEISPKFSGKNAATSRTNRSSEVAQITSEVIDLTLDDSSDHASSPPSPKKIEPAMRHTPLSSPSIVKRAAPPSNKISPLPDTSGTPGPKNMAATVPEAPQLGSAETPDILMLDESDNNEVLQAEQVDQAVAATSREGDVTVSFGEDANNKAPQGRQPSATTSDEDIDGKGDRTRQPLTINSDEEDKSPSEATSDEPAMFDLQEEPFTSDDVSEVSDSASSDGSTVPSRAAVRYQTARKSTRGVAARPQLLPVSPASKVELGQTSEQSATSVASDLAPPVPRPLPMPSSVLASTTSQQRNEYLLCDVVDTPMILGSEPLEQRAGEGAQNNGITLKTPLSTSGAVHATYSTADLGRSTDDDLLEYVPSGQVVDESDSSELMDIENFLTSTSPTASASLPIPEPQETSGSASVTHERRSTRSSRSTSEASMKLSFDSDKETVETLLSTPPEDYSIPSTPAPLKTFGGLPSINWPSFRSDIENFKPKCYFAKDLPHSLQDNINQWSEASRQHPTLVHVLQAAIQENTADDEPDAPLIEIVNDIDGDPTPPWEFHYSNKMWLGEGVSPPDITKLVSCNCRGRCDPKSKTCACIKRQRMYTVDADEVTDFIYDSKGRNKCVGYPIFECNDLCGCGDECRNRVVQHGRKCAVRVQKTKDKGWGVFAGNKKIPEGTFIGIYAGELLTDRVGEMRGIAYNKFGRTYLFDLDFWFLNVSDDWEIQYTVDAYHAGNFTRFLNHSCDPNCQLVPCYINESDIEKPLLAVFSRRDIEPFEEICFSYHGDNGDGEPGSQPQVNDDAVYVKCACNAPNCTGFMFK